VADLSLDNSISRAMGEYSSFTSTSKRFFILFPDQINFHKITLSGPLNDEFTALIEIGF
jgi:hypothetical protein